MEDKMRNLIKKRIILVLGMGLLVIAVASVLGTTLVLHNGEPQQHYYTYEVVALGSPNTSLAPGKKVPIIWQPYLDKTPRLTRGPITLTVWLVHQRTFQKESCGASPGSIPLDTLQVDNTSGRVYQRLVEIPAQVEPGTYELAAQVTHEGRISSCQWRSLVISPSRSQIFQSKQNQRLWQKVLKGGRE